MASIGARTMFIFKSMKKVMHLAMQEDGIEITMEQFGMLTMIRHEPSVSQQLIADTLHLNKSSVMRMIDSLEKKDLVRRVSDPNDRRINLLEVTAAGDKIREQVIEFHCQFSSRIEAGITDSERETYFKVLAQLKANSETIQASFGEK